MMLEAALVAMVRAAAELMACSWICNVRIGRAVSRGRAAIVVIGGVAGLAMRLLGSGRRQAGLVGMTAVAQWMEIAPVGEVQEVLDY